MLLDEARTRLRARVQADPPLPELSNISAQEIHDRLQKNEITALQALRVYQKKIIEALSCNGVCDCIEDAEEAAKSVSSTIDSPIRGMPVSIKENIAIAGYDCSFGLVNYTLKPQSEDSVLVKVLRSVGAVPFVTTTMSPIGACLDGSNDIFGLQRNPYDSMRITGGSSSGEALLISKGASPLGFGTDLAGSVRFPAAMCGICALKPTSLRLSNVGVIYPFKKGVVAHRLVFGPMSKHTCLLADSMRALLVPLMFDLDPRIPPITFREDIFASKDPLTIGFYENIGGDSVLKSVPSVVSALTKAREVLKALGHKVVEFHLPNPDTAVRITMRGMLADGGKGLCKASRYETLNARLRTSIFFLGFPAILRRFFGWIVKSVFNKSIGCSIVDSTGCQSAQEVFKLEMEVSEYQDEFAEAWANAKVDVLLCPALPCPAPLASTPDILMFSSASFLALYNLLDYPAGVVPVGSVSEIDVEASLTYAIAYKKAGDYANAQLAELQSDTRGLPLAVQVVGKPFDEEKVLRVLKEIEEGLA